jgi:molybdopterin converting factor small subunit
MPAVVLVPGPLRPYAAGAARVVLEGAPKTVGAALAALGARHPGVRDRVLTEAGEVRPHVAVFVGMENIRYTGGLETPLPPDAEIAILAAVSGGSPGPAAASATITAPIDRP